MPRQWWDHPVTIETAHLGRFVTINSTERAAEFLLNEWPGDVEAKAYIAAAQILINAHEGRATTDQAREAFITAAREAGIFVFKG
ncbi:DUF982 domain-containing protein [Rhizobium sp. NXC24]|uniref:DUF982 domain-containing protein n=1 Tax=Rhizobium sp. NXC24 TaxID=2048897 RepID=UPI000CDF4E8E|nr:DUF982 domain-containing protein [Rhizobium sp. NXC24]AVA20658.1 hypothetical protein NXC24_CH00991 [Rhizobium sp. NXC24]